MRLRVRVAVPAGFLQQVRIGRVGIENALPDVRVLEREIESRLVATARWSKTGERQAGRLRDRRERIVRQSFGTLDARRCQLTKRGDDRGRLDGIEARFDSRLWGR